MRRCDVSVLKCHDFPQYGRCWSWKADLTQPPARKTKFRLPCTSKCGIFRCQTMLSFGYREARIRPSNEPPPCIAVSCGEVACPAESLTRVHGILLREHSQHDIRGVLEYTVSPREGVNTRRSGVTQRAWKTRALCLSLRDAVHGAGGWTDIVRDDKTSTVHYVHAAVTCTLGGYGTATGSPFGSVFGEVPQSSVTGLSEKLEGVVACESL